MRAPRRRSVDCAIAERPGDGACVAISDRFESCRHLTQPGLCALGKNWRRRHHSDDSHQAGCWQRFTINRMQCDEPAARPVVAPSNKVHRCRSIAASFYAMRFAEKWGKEREREKDDDAKTCVCIEAYHSSSISTCTRISLSTRPDGAIFSRSFAAAATAAAATSRGRITASGRYKGSRRHKVERLFSLLCSAAL